MIKRFEQGSKAILSHAHQENSTFSGQGEAELEIKFGCCQGIYQSEMGRGLGGARLGSGGARRGGGTKNLRLGGNVAKF